MSFSYELLLTRLSLRIQVTCPGSYIVLFQFPFQSRSRPLPVYVSPPYASVEQWNAGVLPNSSARRRELQ